VISPVDTPVNIGRVERGQKKACSSMALEYSELADGRLS
jgi:hypothetical protein